MTIKPLFQGIDRRIELDREDSDSAYFHALALKLEYITKLVTAGLLACVGDDSDRHRYSVEHTLVRADSIGDWVRALNTILVGPAAQFFLPLSAEVVKALTERVGDRDWRHSAVIDMKTAAEEVGAEVNIGRRVALRQMFEIGAQLRNRSRGHGATTTEQYSRASPYLHSALTALTENIPLFGLPWVYLHRNLSGKYRVSALAGDISCFEHLKRTNREQLQDGVYIHLERPVQVKLVFTGPDLHDIALPNGGYTNGSFETLSYVTNDSIRQEGGDWSLPAGQLPPSDTDGGEVLEPFGKTSANVPPILADYVPRDDVVSEVQRELLQTDLHPVLSLTGPGGGIGKTTVAIAALHAICDREVLPYEVILWISARDIDLLEAGAKPVRPRVITQDDISRAAVDLVEPSERHSPDFNATMYFEPKSGSWRA